VNTDELERALIGAERRVLEIQAKLHRWARAANGTCGEPGAMPSRTPGSGSGSGETDRSKDRHRAPGRLHQQQPGPRRSAPAVQLYIMLIIGTFDQAQGGGEVRLLSRLTEVGESHSSWRTTWRKEAHSPRT
jgi:hypothetical protein